MSIRNITKGIPIRFWIVSAIVAITTLGDALLYAVLPAVPDSFGIKVWQIGILLGANRFVRLLTNEIAGRLSRRFEHRQKALNRQLFIAAIAGGFITAGYMLPLGFLWLLFLRISWGSCWSLLRLEGYVSALAVSTYRTRGKIFGFYHSMIRFGQGGGVLVGGILADILTIPMVFLLFSCCTIIFSFFALSPFASDRSARGQTDYTPQYENEKDYEKTFNKSGGKGATLLILGVFTFALASTEQMAANLTGLLVAQRIPDTLSGTIGVASITGTLLSYRALFIVLFGPVIGMGMDRYGRMVFIACVILLQCIAITGLSVLDTWQWTITFLIVQLAAGVISRYLVNLIAADLAPKHRASVHVGRFTTFLDLGTATGPIIGFAAYDAFGIVSISIIALFFLTTAVAMAFLIRKKLPAGTRSSIRSHD